MVCAVAPQRTLLECLRYDLGLTGSKQGCDKGDCGACTVLVEGEPTLACISLAHACAGRSVVTVEGLARGPELHPLQDAFDLYGAAQCGFCTPGILMALYGYLGENPAPDEGELREAIAGNLCRCTGYQGILAAARVAAARMRGRAAEAAAPRP